MRVVGASQGKIDGMAKGGGATSAGFSARFTTSSRARAWMNPSVG